MRSAWVKMMKQMSAQSSTMLVIWNLDNGFFMRAIIIIDGKGKKKTLNGGQ
jgi:hypothetical protein